MIGWEICAVVLMVAAAQPVNDTPSVDADFLEYLGMEAESGWSEFFELMPVEPGDDAAVTVPPLPVDENHDES